MKRYNKGDISKKLINWNTVGIWLSALQLPETFLFVIQVTIQLTNHSVTGHVLIIQLPDLSDNRMPTVIFIDNINNIIEVNYTI